MKKVTDWLEKKLVPFSNKLNANIWIQTIRDSILQITPFIFLGSIFSFLGVITQFTNVELYGYALSDWTFGKISLFIAFLIPFNYCEKKRLKPLRIMAGATSLILFLMMITPEYEISQVVGFGSGTLGATGMISAMVAGIFTANVMNLFKDFSFFKKDSAIPNFIKEWFDLMLPSGVVVIIGFILTFALKINLFALIEQAFAPFKNGMELIPVYMLFKFVWVALFAMGLSPWLLTGIWTPVALANIAANTALVAAGTATPDLLSIVTKEVDNIYISIGGTGATLGLNLLFLFFSKSKRLKVLGKTSIVPSLFCINEPIVFGSVVWNPLLMIPFCLTAFALPFTTWLFTKVICLFPIPTYVFNLYFIPAPILSFMTTGTFRSVIFTLLQMGLSALIYYPFFKVYDKQELQKELEGE